MTWSEFKAMVDAKLATESNADPELNEIDVWHNEKGWLIIDFDSEGLCFQKILGH